MRRPHWRFRPKPDYFGAHWSWYKDAKYWRLWKRLQNVLMNGRETWTQAEENRQRRAFQLKAIGQDKSHYQFTDKNFDDFIKEALAVLEPDNVAAQINQVGQEAKRAMWVIRQLMRELGKDDNFVMGVIEQIEDGIDPNSPDAAWQRERERTGRRHRLDDLTVPELKRVIDALRSIKRRGKKPDRVYHLQKA